MSLSIAISLLSLGASLLIFYVSYARKGKITVPRPAYVGARQITQSELNSALEGRELAPSFESDIDKIKIANDIIFLPLDCFTTGAIARVIRFKLIVNGVHVFHGMFELDRSNLTSMYNPTSSLKPTIGFSILPRQTTSKLMCFTQKPTLKTITGPLILDLWHQEKNEWKKTFRIVWKDWNHLLGDFTKFHYVHSSESYDYLTGFEPEYDVSILER